MKYLQWMGKLVLVASGIVVLVAAQGDVSWAAQTQDFIRYEIHGIGSRVDLVFDRMAKLGYSVQAVRGEEVMGRLHGKPWPGVQVTSSPGGGIFIPVSNAAIKKGLCDDQDHLIKSLPKYHKRACARPPIVRERVKYVPVPYPVEVPHYVPYLVPVAQPAPVIAPQINIIKRKVRIERNQIIHRRPPPCPPMY